MGDYMPIETQTDAAVSIESGISPAASQALLEEDENSKLEQLQRDIKELRKKETQQTNRLKEAKSYWESKVQKLTQEVVELRSEAKAREVELRNLERPNEVKRQVPGPRCLLCVLGPTFNGITLLVILANMLTMFVQHFYKDELDPYHKAILGANQFFLGFYVLELWLKMVLLRCKLLCGPLCTILWNWLDLLVVLAGIVDQWVLPFAFEHGYIDEDNVQALAVLRYVRLLRMARVLKILHTCMFSDFSWTEGHRFQGIMTGVIAVNSLVIALQADYPEFPCWWYFERVFLLIYVVELTVRLAHWRCRFFYEPREWGWNWLDLVLVAGGIVDQWMVPFFRVYQHCAGKPDAQPIELLASNHSRVGQIVMVLRLARLLRVLRLVRLVRSIQPLCTLVLGVLQAMQGMFWVMLLAVFFLYLWAIAGVTLVGHGLVFGGSAPLDVVKIFPSVPEAMYTLFKVMNGNLTDVEPLFEIMPITKLFIVSFMFISSWAILSILTAVVSENMINTSETHRAELKQDRDEAKKQRMKDKLEEVFFGIDKIGDSLLSREEFQRIVEDEQRADDIAEACGLQKEDLVHLFDVLSTTRVGDSGEVLTSIRRLDFVDGLQKESREVTERAVMRLEKRLSLIERSLQLVEQHHTKDAERQANFLQTVDAKLNAAREMEVKAAELGPAMAKFEQRLGALEAAGAACRASAEKEAADIQSLLVRLEQRLDSETALVQESKEAVEAAKAVMEAAGVAGSANAKAAAAQADAVKAELMATPCGSSQYSQYTLEAAPLLEAGWEAKFDEDLPLPVPQPRFMSMDSSPPAASMGKEPVIMPRASDTVGEASSERVGTSTDPIDLLLN